MEQLQRALDRSLAHASALTRSLFAGTTWNAGQVVRLVNAERSMTIASVTHRGAPHAAVVIAACLDGEFHFTVSEGSLLLRNLQRDPKVAFSVTKRNHAVMGQGTALMVARSLDAPDLIEQLAAATDAGAFTPEGWDGYIYRIVLGRIFAN